MDQIFKNPIQVQQDVIIGISNHPKAERLKISVPLSVFEDLTWFSMSIAIHLDDE